MSRHTTQTRRGFIHQITALGLGLGLAASLIAMPPAHAAEDPTIEELGAILEGHLDAYLEALTEDPAFEYATVDGATDALSRHTHAINSASTIVSKHLTERFQMVRADFAPHYAEHGASIDEHIYDMMESLTGEINTSAAAGEEARNDEWAKKLRKAANLLNTIAGALSGRLMKIGGIFIIDPTVIAPGYVGGAAPEAYGQIVTGYGNGAASSAQWEIYDRAGYGDSYGDDYGFGWSDYGDDRFGPETVETSESSETSETTESSATSATSETSGEACPLWGENGEAAFATEQEAWDCGADYIYSETGEQVFPEDDEPNSCVWTPIFRFSYSVFDSTLAPDMTHSMADPMLREAFFDALPGIVENMNDGDLLRITSVSTWTLADGGLAFSSPVVQVLQYQTALTAEDGARADGVLVGYSCATVPVAARTMAPIGNADVYTVGEDGAVLDELLRADLQTAQ